MPQLELSIDFKYVAKPLKHKGMRPFDQLRLFEGHLCWVDPAPLVDFPGFVGDTLATNPNMRAGRIDAIVACVRTLADDLVVASHR